MITEKEKEKLGKIVDVLFEDDDASVFDTLAVCCFVIFAILFYIDEKY